MQLPHALREFAACHLVADTPALPVGVSRRSALGALLGVLLTGALLLLFPDSSGTLVAAIGASSIILFALPHSPLAQPWSVLGGYLVATCSALLSVSIISHPLLAGALAVGVTVWLMTRWKCIHPPGGAVVLLVAAEGAPTLPHAAHLIGTVLANVLLVLFVAWVVNNRLLRQRYPQCRTPAAPGLHRTSDAAPIERTGLSHQDLDDALRAVGSFVDIQESELVQIYDHAVKFAFERHMGVSCGDIMARDLVTVEYGTELEEAWSLLRRHKVKALPVVDGFRRVVGIVTVADFLRQLDDTTAAGLAVRLQGLLRRTPGMSSQKAEVVGQIISSQVYSAHVDTPVAELVEKLSDLGMHHIPVIDAQKKLVGMVTQSDLIAALYRRVALSVA